MVQQSQTIEVITVDSPPSELDNTSGGMCVGIGPVDIVVGTSHTGVNCNIVGKTLTLVLEDVVEGMDVGGVLAAEGTGCILVGTSVQVTGVVVDAYMLGQRVDLDGRRGE